MCYLLAFSARGISFGWRNPNRRGLCGVALVWNSTSGGILIDKAPPNNLSYSGSPHEKIYRLLYPRLLAFSYLCRNPRASRGREAENGGPGPRRPRLFDLWGALPLRPQSRRPPSQMERPPFTRPGSSGVSPLGASKPRHRRRHLRRPCLWGLLWSLPCGLFGRLAGAL